MQATNMHDAKTHFSKLIKRVRNGEEILISKAGKPVAKIIPYEQGIKPRRPGYWRGKVEIAEDFDELPNEIMVAFLGENE